MFPFFCKNCGGQQHALRYRFSPWAQVFGNLAALLTLLFWRSKTEVFVDRACIHQGFLEKNNWRGMHAKTNLLGFNSKGSWKFAPHAASNDVTRSTFPKSVGILKHVIYFSENHVQNFFFANFPPLALREANPL